MGLIFVAVGGSFKTRIDEYTDIIDSIFPSISIFPVLLVTIGAMIFFVAFLGCCGALTGNLCKLISVLHSTKYYVHTWIPLPFSTWKIPGPSTEIELTTFGLSNARLWKPQGSQDHSTVTVTQERNSSGLSTSILR